MSLNGILWPLISNDFSDEKGTNYASFYGGFKEIDLLQVVAVFECLKGFGLDVLLGIDMLFGI